MVQIVLVYIHAFFLALVTGVLAGIPILDLLGFMPAPYIGRLPHYA